MEPQNPLHNNQIESQSNNQISDKNPAPNNNINSQEQIQVNSESNKEMENNENQNINDNNSDFINNNNYNEEEAVAEEEENNQNIEQNNNDRLIQMNNNNNMNNGEFEMEGEFDYNNNNEPNIYNNQNNNNINDNMENINENNENENMQQPQQIINAENIDEPLQNYLYELQNKLNLVMNENDKLRMINQKIVIGLNESKKRNMALNQKIKILNLQNQKMNQELIKIKQVKNNDINVNNLKNQIQNYEKMFYKLNNDKKILESKIINMQMQSPNSQIKNLNLLNYKNNQLIRSPKAKMAFTQLNTMTNENNQVYKNQIIILEKNNKKLSQSNIELENQNKYLQKENQKMFVDLKNKDNYILSLKDKITEFNKEYNKQINNFSKDNEQKQSCLDQLFFEREQLVKENQELKDRLNQVNYKLNEFSVMNKMYKTEYNDKVKQMYEDKLEEYKRKIIILKQRVNELLGIETHGNNILSRGNSARLGHQNLSQNAMKKNRSFKYNKNLNILTDFNMYNEKNRTVKDYRKIYSNFNFGTK